MTTFGFLQLPLPANRRKAGLGYPIHNNIKEGTYNVSIFWGNPYDYRRYRLFW